jgi:hypothetical protein
MPGERTSVAGYIRGTKLTYSVSYALRAAASPPWRACLRSARGVLISTHAPPRVALTPGEGRSVRAELPPQA